MDETSCDNPAVTEEDEKKDDSQADEVFIMQAVTKFVCPDCGRDASVGVDGVRTEEDNERIFGGRLCRQWVVQREALPLLEQLTQHAQQKLQQQHGADTQVVNSSAACSSVTVPTPLVQPASVHTLAKQTTSWVMPQKAARKQVARSAGAPVASVTSASGSLSAATVPGHGSAHSVSDESSSRPRRADVRTESYNSSIALEALYQPLHNIPLYPCFTADLHAPHRPFALLAREHLDVTAPIVQAYLDQQLADSPGIRLVSTGGRQGVFATRLIRANTRLMPVFGLLYTRCDLVESDTECDDVNDSDYEETTRGRQPSRNDVRPRRERRRKVF